MRETIVLEKLSKQLRPPPLPTTLSVAETADYPQNLLSFFSCNKPQILAARGSLEGGPLSPASQADRHSHLTKPRSMESDSNQDLCPPHGLGLGSCLQGQGHMQWSNKRERVWAPWKITLAIGLVMRRIISPQKRYAEVLTPLKM